jgi:hypothetical protein
MEVLSYLSKTHNSLNQRKDLHELMYKLSPSLKHLVTKRLFFNIIQKNPVFDGLPEVHDFILDNIVV